MSTFKVEIVAIDDINPHPNAERLELAKINDWNCVVPKGVYQKGSKAIYIPIDSVLPNEIESKVFGPDSKVKLSKSRVKTIKLRGAISQGLVVSLDTFGLEKKSVGTDITELLGITKYEPPTPSWQMPSNGPSKLKPKENPYFKKYGGLENGKNYPKVFEEGEIVEVTEKIHGSHIRAGRLPFVANNLLDRIKGWLGFNPKFEWVYGSNNVQLQRRNGSNNYYGEDVYGKLLQKYNVRELLKDNEAIHGELYGDGIQKNYTYGCVNEHKLVIFDVKVDGEYLSTDAARLWCEERGLPYVPVLYRGPFNLEAVKELTKGDSVLAPSQKIREGVVVRPVQELQTYIGRKILKYISEAYLLGDQTDFH